LTLFDELFITVSFIEDYCMLFLVLSDELQEIKIPIKTMAEIMRLIF